MDVFHPLLATNMLDPNHLLTSLGTIGLIVVIFLESCFAPLPGDSLLFTAGLFASQGKLNLAVILLGCSAAAVAGNQVGYWVGRRAGPSLFNRPNSRLFKPENVAKTHAYFEHYGVRTILIARVVPIVRGLAPIVAGVGRMPYRIFTAYNVGGGVIWACAFVMLGWGLGKKIHNVDHYVLPLAALVVVVTSIPLVFEYYRTKRKLAADSTSN
jgi:membrane-associated protein